MVAPVDPYMVAFAEAGADIITVHTGQAHTHRTIQSIKSLERAGLSLNPATPASAIGSLNHQLDLILVMTIN